MYRIAVVGDRDSIYGFAALGLETFPAESSEEAAKRLRLLADQDYAVIYLTETLASELEEELERYRETLLPAVILIPGVRGNTGMGIQMVKKSVEQAVGSDIIFNEKSGSVSLLGKASCCFNGKQKEPGGPLGQSFTCRSPEKGRWSQT